MMMRTKKKTMAYKKIQLSAAVCKKCWITTVGKDWWNKKDRDLFFIGQGCCPSGYALNLSAEIWTNAPPPKWCPYKLEHGVAKGMKNG